MPNLIIGLHGKRGVGKDTLAKYLVEKQNFTQVAFADVLRFQVADAWGVDRDKFVKEWDQLKDIPSGHFSLRSCVDIKFVEFIHARLDLGLLDHNTPRTCACLYSDYMKSLHGQGVYFTIAKAIIASIPGNVVVSDVRYFHEAEGLKFNFENVKLIHLLRSSLPNYDCDHNSEQTLPTNLLDFWMFNDAGISQLENSMCDLLAKYRAV